MAAAAVARATARVSRVGIAPVCPSAVATASRSGVQKRGMAVYRDFPEWGIKKNPFIEKNEIARETKFYSWWPGMHNYLALFITVGVVPVLLYTNNRSDIVTKATSKRLSKTAEKDYA